MSARFASLLALTTLSASSFAAFDLSFSVTSDRRIDNTLVGFTSDDRQHEGAALIGGFDAGTYDYTVSVPGLREQYASYRYSLIATYLSPGGAEGLVIALRPEIATQVAGREFSSVFSGVNEASVVAAVKGSASGDFYSAYWLRRFFLDNVGLMPLGESGGTIVGFSRAQVIGSVSPAPVPEPASWMALGVGAVALVRRRRR